MGKIKELTDKWDKLGFLENCENKPQLARIYEDLALILVSNQIPLKNKGKIDSVVFPIVYRLYINRKLNFDKIELIIMIKDLDKKIKTIEKMNEISYLTMDVEAEFAYEYAQTYIK